MLHVGFRSTYTMLLSLDVLSFVLSMKHNMCKAPKRAINIIPWPSN